MFYDTKFLLETETDPIMIWCKERFMREYVSLFSGAMGLDIGLEHNGLECKVCVERDTSCVSTIWLNRKMQAIQHVSSLNEEMLEHHKGCFLVAGGPPCQAFSTAGRRKAFDDPRGVMLLEFGRVVKIVKPRFFVFENVRGLLSAKLDDGGMILDYVINSYKDIGYKVIHALVDAVDYGVPQFRDRVLVVGSRDGENIFIPRPTHFMQHQDASHRWKTLGDAIHGIKDEAKEFMEFSESRKQWLRKIPAGGNWKNLSEEDAKAAMKDAFFSGGGKTGFFRRLTYLEPSPTLVTSPIQKSTLLCHPEETRPLTVAEYAAIQQFPESWKFYGSIEEKYKQIGNAVPIGLAKEIGAMFVSVADGVSLISTRRKSS